MTSTGKRPPLREELSLFEATIAREGTTTGAGAVTGDSIIDAGLIGVGADSFLSMLMIVYPGDFNLVDSMDITAFDNVTGEITLNRAYKGVAAAIPVGVRYKIVTFRFVPAEVAALTVLVNALMADVGDASTATLGSIFGILGDPATPISTVLGFVFDLVNAILVLTETGGTITTDGLEQDVYINNAPAGVYDPNVVKIDFSNQTAAETVVVRYYERIIAGGGWILADTVPFVGVQAVPDKFVELVPNRFGVWVTMERTVGGAFAYIWEAIYRV